MAISIDKLLSELNAEQRDAVTTIQGPVLVLAGAGTGKTKAITTRIAWMLHQRIRPESIVAVSFTNKAAREMRERLSSFVGEKQASQVELSTFHSFALKLLRKYHRQAGLPAKFSIADEGQSKSLLKETLRELKLEELFSLQLAGERIAHFKDQVFEGEDFAKCKNIFDSAVMRSLFEAYNRRLRLYNMVDFDDLVYLAVLVLKKNPDVLAEVHNTYHYLMVDEYQDTSTAQFELIRLLSGPRRNVCVVGDDDQSIYSWRGAKADVLFLFLDVFAGAKRVSLEQNYRCSPHILNAANTVIAENTKRLAKTLWSRQANEHPIHIHASENERDEALHVAQTIAQIRDEAPHLHWHDFAVLVRASNQIIHLEQVFAEKDIPYHIHGGTKFFDRHEVRDLFSYLRLAHNPADLNSLFRIINLPSRGIGSVTLEKIKTTFESAKQSNPSVKVDDILVQMSKDHKGIASFLEDWGQARTKLREAHTTSDLAHALSWCFENAGLKKEILLHSTSMQAARFRTELVTKALELIEKLNLPDPSLDALVDALHLEDFAPREKNHDSTGKVQIMTIHASKGLEFHVVFLIGLEEGILPHEKSMTTPAGVEEERRLFYVAMTRAKQRLFISHCGFRSKGQRGAKEHDRTPSRFLFNIPTDLIRSTETDPEAEEARRMQAARRLFELFR